MNRLLSIAITIVVIILFTFGSAFATPGMIYNSVVEGTGVYPDDIIQVQNAVNSGGNILLKGNFNFGNWTFPTPPPTPAAPQRVVIKKDVGIYGETDYRGNPRTKINGGYFTFFSPLPSTTTTPPYVVPDPIPPGPKITIQGIIFEKALWAPIHIAYTSGASIIGNKITRVVPFGNGIVSFDPLFPDFKYLSSGILCGPWFAQTGYHPLGKRIYREGAFTGLLNIQSNFIDLEADFPGQTLGQGIYVNWGTGITAKISDNTIANVSRNSIEVLDNHKVNGKGSVVVEGNDIVTSAVGIPYPGLTTPNGIAFGWFLDTIGYDPDNNGLHMVMHNSIRTKGNTSVGIMVMADESLAVNNKIASEGVAAVGLAVGGSHCLVAHNKMEGIGKYAVNVTPVAINALKLDASYNFFQGNNYNLFDAAQSDLHFAPGASHNVVVGHSGNVSDEGEDNRITNFNFRGKDLKGVTKSNLRKK